MLLCLLQNSRGVLLGQTAADRAGLLGPEVKGQVLLVLVEEAELSPLLGVDDGQDTGNRLAEVVAVQGMLAICFCLIIRTSIFHDGRERIRMSGSTYILVSLVPEDTIFWMRS
jgi:hypothetical protein